MIEMRDTCDAAWSNETGFCHKDIAISFALLHSSSGDRWSWGIDILLSLSASRIASDVLGNHTGQTTTFICRHHWNMRSAMLCTYGFLDPNFTADTDDQLSQPNTTRVIPVVVGFNEIRHFHIPKISRYVLLWPASYVLNWYK